MSSFQSNKNVLSLTEDLLVRVHEKLAVEWDRKSFRLVCREFRRIDSLNRKHLRVLRIEFLPSLLHKHPQLQSLDLSACPRIDDRVVSLLLTRVDPGSNSLSWAIWTRGLKSLVLSRATGLRFSGFEMLARACPCLESVDVSYCCGFGDREAAALSCAIGLRELKMDKCLQLSDVGLAMIAVGCLKLEKFSLKWCMEITDLGVDLLCKKCVDLKYLDVSYLKVTNESLHSIASLLKLEVLGLMACPLIDDVGLQFIERGCPLLKVIDVSRCEGVSSSGLISVIRGHDNLVELNAGYCLSDLSTTLLHRIKNLKHLEMIRIDGARISESSFQVMSTNCKSLIEIGLSKCVGVTNMGIIRLVSGCINLKILNLTCCHSITDAAISVIANSCRNLVCLKLESCNMITEKGLCQLGSFCLLLEEIDLTDCCGVNDKGLEYLSRCSELSCLKLGLCTNISDKGLFYMGSNCTKIHELDLYRCTGIGDDGLDALSRGCKKLKILNLSYCNEVSDRGLGYIGHLEELSDLELRGLVKITGVGLVAVAAGCKRLADLDLKHCEKVGDLGFWALAYYSRNLRQINLSYCTISDMALCMVLGNLTRLQDAKLVNLGNVTVEGFELALRACCIRIKKACAGIDNLDLCLSNIQAELQNIGPQTPSSVLHAALRATLNEARQTIETITKFTGLSVSYREQIAIEDCKELLDFSVSELAWSLAEMKRIRDGDRNAQYEGNLKAWLSAALSNQDTCLEGFEGTDRHLEGFIRGNLKQVTQLIGNVLAMYTQLHSLPFRPPRNSTSKNTSSKYPEWLTDGDQELLRTNPRGMHVDAIVSLDGSGHYRTITDAINEAPSYSNRRYIIYVKKGVYKENIDMKKKKTNIMLVGHGIGQTVVTGNRNFLQGLTTFRTATVAVSGKGFIARDMTFRNTTAPQNHQAVALRVDSDQSAFYRCSMEGYQDTLYIHSLRQFYRECNIYGTIDFIFGNGAAVLQNCKIFTRVPLPLQKVTITAQGRNNPNQSTGFSIQNSYIFPLNQPI